MLKVNSIYYTRLNINTKLKEGTIIKGTIAELEEDAVIVDIGAKVEGRISESLFFRRTKRNLKLATR